MIQAQDLVVTYGSHCALNRISFTLQSGDVVGLVGPNGAGKTTLMKSLVGICPIKEGEIIINGNSVPQQPLLAKRNSGFLFEHNPLYTEMYVQEYLFFVARLRGISKQKVTQTIEEVGLLPELHKKIKALSKGYKQRVGLAQALLHDPFFLVLDEPTNGLDPNQIQEVRELIQKRKEAKVTLISSHILSEIERLCNRVLLLDKGVLVLNASLKEIQQEYGSLGAAFRQKTANKNFVDGCIG